MSQIQSFQWLGLAGSKLTVKTFYVPKIALQIQERYCVRVDFPEPEGPIIKIDFIQYENQQSQSKSIKWVIQFFKISYYKNKFYIIYKMLSKLLAFTLLIVATIQASQSSTNNSQSKESSQVVYRFLVFTQECYENFFVKFNWFNIHCIKITFSKALGYALVLGGAIIKFPQIYNIIKMKSVYGISFVAVIFELSTNILATGYCIFKNNPFSLYGQNVFIGFQMLFIILLFVAFGKQNKILYVFFFLAMSGAAYFVTDPYRIPQFIINHSITVQTILICVSRSTQIIKTHQLKSTGSLALITFALTVLGNFARIATILVQASNDVKFLMSVVSVTILNSYILFQFYLYRNSKTKKE